MKVELVVLGSPSLTVLMVSVDRNQHTRELISAQKTSFSVTHTRTHARTHAHIHISTTTTTNKQTTTTTTTKTTTKT